jgi:signal transduction histidine kinase
MKTEQAMRADTDAKCLLIVDDTPENLEVLVEILSPEYRTKVALTGEKAVGLCAGDGPPDLILLDVMMPGMDGYEVCRRLKVAEPTRDIPVIFVTSKTEEQDETKGLELGAVDYITKPISPAIVKARVRTHLALLTQRQQIEESYVRLQELESLRDNLTGMIVHDMRSPLMAIMGGVQLLSEKLGEADEDFQFATMASAAASELNEMVTSLLDISRMESGHMPLERSECNMKGIAASAVTSMTDIAEFEEIRLAVTGESTPAAVDEKLLHRVFQNLLNNAIKFSPGGSTVLVTVARDGECVRVAVADSGPGISGEYREKIFEKFGQVEARKKSQKHFAGLGLTFCKLAVEAHGGQIGVDSEVGRGSTFWFTLPCHGSN